MKKVWQMAAICSLVFLAACGGGGGGSTTPPTQTVTGRVADGYISGATVCLDQNGNKLCDAGEPTATTTSGGYFTFSNVASTLLAQCPVVVQVPANAVDSNNPGQPIGTPYVLTAPAGNTGFVSPLTTLVQAQVEAGSTLADAKQQVKAKLGLNSLDPLADYTPGNAGATSDQKVAAGVAQVVANTLATNLVTLTTANSGAATNGQVVYLAAQQAMGSLKTISDQVSQLVAAQGANPSVLSSSEIQQVVNSTTAVLTASDAQQQLSAITTPTGTMQLTVSLQGSGAANVEGLEAIITLPAGVSVPVDANGDVQTGVIVPHGVAAGGTLNVGYQKPAGGKLGSIDFSFIGTLFAGDIFTVNVGISDGKPDISAFDFTTVRLSQFVGSQPAPATNASLSLH
jgi:hypothetical protein